MKFRGLVLSLALAATATRIVQAQTEQEGKAYLEDARVFKTIKYRAMKDAPGARIVRDVMFMRTKLETVIAACSQKAGYPVKILDRPLNSISDFDGMLSEVPISLLIEEDPLNWALQAVAGRVRLTSPTARVEIVEGKDAMWFGIAEGDDGREHHSGDVRSQAPISRIAKKYRLNFAHDAVQHKPWAPALMFGYPLEEVSWGAMLERREDQQERLTHVVEEVVTGVFGYGEDDYAISEFDPFEGSVIIDTHADAHQILEQTLGALWGRERQQVALEWWLLDAQAFTSADPLFRAALAAGPSALDKAGTTALVKHFVATPTVVKAHGKVIAANGQVVSSGSSSSKAFVTGYHMEVGVGSMAPDPVVETFTTGHSVELCPWYDLASGFVHLEARMGVARMESDIADVKTSAGPLQTPTIISARFRSSAWLENAGMCVWGMQSDLPDERNYFAVRAIALPAREVFSVTPREEAFPLPIETFVLDLAAASLGNPSFSAPDVHPESNAQSWDDRSIGSYGPDDDTRMVPSFDDLVETMVDSRNPAFKAVILDPETARIALLGAPEAMKQTAAVADKLRREALRQVSFEVCALALPREQFAEIFSDLALTSDESMTGILTDETRKRLEAEATLAPELVVARASTTACEGQTTALATGRAQRFLTDFQVEVAQGSAGGEPVTSTLFEGLSVSLMGKRTPVGAVRTTVNVGFSKVGNVATKELTHGTLHLPELKIFKLHGEHVIAPGETLAIFGTSEIHDGKMIVILLRVQPR